MSAPAAATPRKMTPEVEGALGRLFDIADRDTGTSGRVANLLLAWWNARENGGFDLTDLWLMDDSVCRDCLLLIGYVAMHREYHEAEFGLRFERIWRQWREPKKTRRASQKTR